MSTRYGFLLGLALGLTFSFGFATATWMTPHAQAQSPAQRDRYEYTTIDHGWDQARWANEMGRQGWRFLGFEYGNPHKLLFERPL